jgi:hypothetical protein
MELALLLVVCVGISILPVKLTADAFDAKHKGLFSCLMGAICALAVGILVKRFLPFGAFNMLAALLGAGIVYMVILGTALYRGIIIALVQLAVTFLAFLITTAILGSSIRMPFW